MSVTIDPDVEKAATILQAEFEAGKLMSIAQALGSLAPALWGRYPKVEIAPFVLTSEQHTPSIATQ